MPRHLLSLLLPQRKHSPDVETVCTIKVPSYTIVKLVKN